MEFWGVEVKSGEPFTVNPGEDRVLHLSQATLGETKKDKSNESVCIYVKIDDKKLVLGTLNSEKLPQQVFDLVFDKEFQVSHNSKNGSVYFYGYTAPNNFDESDDDEEIDSDEELPLQIENHVKDVAKSKPAAKAAEPKKDVKPETDDSDEDSDDDDDDESGSDSDVPMGEFGADSDEDDESDDDDDSEEEDEKPKKEVAINNKKRPNDSAAKTPAHDKKAKLATPKKSDGKKGAVHVDTPHPKQAGKTPANKSSPKSAEGSNMCKPCKRSFKSETALDSHKKAKHSSGK